MCQSQEVAEVNSQAIQQTKPVSHMAQIAYTLCRKWQWADFSLKLVKK